MKRLTLDKPVGKMSMIELAHNGCYIDKNRNARYRDYSMDIDARDFVRKIYKDKNIAMPYEFWNDNDTFDEIMLANMEDGLEEVDGFIALFYRNLWAMAELREHLKVYEDLEEQGFLLKLPCKVGDAVYRINEGAENPIIEMLVTNIIISLARGNRFRIDTKDIADGNEHYYDVSHIGKKVFLTKEATEQALIKMGYENECKYGTIAIVGAGRNAGGLMKQQITLLEELESYRTIGTLQECKEAITKSQEMKLLPPKESLFIYKGICPVCGNHILLSENFCSQCGQKVGVVQR